MFGGDAKHPKVVKPRVSILFFYILPFTYQKKKKNFLSPTGPTPKLKSAILSLSRV